MNIRISASLLAALALASCAHQPTAAHRATDTRNYVVYTGSNIPRPRNEITPFALAATTPRGSVDRRAGALAPTEPVVGATNNAEPGDNTEPLHGTDGPAGSR